MLEFILNSLTVYTLILPLIVCTAFIYKSFLRKTKRPPGPSNFVPIFGYIPFLSSKPYKDFDEMRKTFGDVFGLTLGSRYTVVLNSAETIREGLGKDAFLDRPPGFFHLSDQYTNLGSMVGKEWKEHMNFTRSTLRYLITTNPQARENISIEIAETVVILEKNSGTDIDIRDVLTTPINNFIFTLVNGKCYNRHDPINQALIGSQEANILIEPTSAIDNVPVFFPIALLIKSKFRKLRADLKIFENMMSEEVNFRLDSFDENHLNDYMDYFLMEAQKRNGQDIFDPGTLLGSAQTLLIAGSHTLRLTLEWLLLQMAQDQRSQEKVYSEILSVQGKERPPTREDKTSMPFTQAVILEAARRNTIAPTSVIRWAREDTEVAGYHIPKGTRVISNLRAAHMDPQNWMEPERFAPERFLNNKGQICKFLPVCYMPFSYGKRSCPVDRVANNYIFLFLVSIIQRFRILPPSCGLNMDSLNQGNNVPKFPLVRFETR